MKKAVIIILLLFLFGCGSKGGHDISASRPQGEHPSLKKANPSPANVAVANSEVLDIINKVRSEDRLCGDQHSQPVGPIKWNEKLVEAARRHSKDMARNDLLGHTGSDKSSPTDRLLATGYRIRTIRENVGAGQKSIEEVVNKWLKSPGHCRNIMADDVTEIGLYAVKGDWTNFQGRLQHNTIFWTLVLAEHREQPCLHLSRVGHPPAKRDPI